MVDMINGKIIGKVYLLKMMKKKIGILISTCELLLQL